MSRAALRAVEGGRPVQPDGERASMPAARHSGPAAGGGGRGRSLLAGALAGAEAFLLEPAEPPGPLAPSAPAGPRPVLAVYGLAGGCGTTTVTRALAAELAQRDPSGAAAVMCETRASAIPLATQAACRLARALEDLPGAATRAVGRLALVRAADPLALAESAQGVAPLVFDAGASALGGVPAALAQRCLLVTTPAVEPALARVAAECLLRVGPAPLVVLNRAEQPVGEGLPEAGWLAPFTPAAAAPAGAAGSASEAAAATPAATDVLAGELAAAFGDDLVVLPDSRMGAQLALGGREPRGELGRAVATLADRCTAPEAGGGG